MMTTTPRTRTMTLGIAIGLLLACAGVSQVFGHDRPSGPKHKTRSAVIAKNGMAATSQPLATEAAIRVLRQGGNAIDAAIAANAVLGVVEPMSCGMGGDLFAIVWDAKTQKLYGLNASGRMPRKATIAEYQARGEREIPDRGPLSWSVPGCVDGWDQLRQRFGSMPWDRILTPAWEHADQGFPVSEIIASSWRGAEPRLAEIPESARCYLPGGHAPRTGDVFRNPGAARTLKAIMSGGRDAFYRGPIAAEIVKHSEQYRGLFALEDFAEHASVWVDPVSTNYRGFDIWELPPNGQGIAVLQILNLLEPYDLKAMGHNSASALHLMIEAKKLAFEDRAKYYADPDFVKVPVRELISKAYAEERGKSISRERALDRLAPGTPSQGDTIYMTVVDKDRNCVSLIQSIYRGFGSFHVPGDLGFALQNRGSSMSLDSNRANALAPGKRPFHTIIPGFATKGGRPWLSFGVMGGDMQPQGHAQAVCNMIDFGMDPQEAGEAARFCHSGSSTPKGAAAEAGGSVALESGVSEKTRQRLQVLGHVLKDEEDVFGGYQAIQIDWERGVLIGGSDPRKDGAAMGY